MTELTEAERVHMALLAKWRHAMDLVGPGPLEPHFEDAAQAMTGLDANGRWADLGSGAGFPGIALAARHPGLEVALVESRQRRVEFLKAVVAEAGLKHVHVLHQRTEDLAGAQFDGVVARAYRPPGEAWSDATRLLKPGGRCVLLLAEGQRTPEPPPESDWRYTVDGKIRRRVILRTAN